MSVPICERIITLATFDRRELYIVRPKFGSTIADCVSCALWERYHRDGSLVSSYTDLAMAAASTDKVLLLYKYADMDVQIAGEGVGVGYIYMHEDLDGEISLIAHKDVNGKYVLVSSAFTDRESRPMWG